MGKRDQAHRNTVIKSHNRRFPRSRDRGLIEATRRHRHLWNGVIFPRSRDRGLIEADRTDPCVMPRRLFPRSRDRGLIEARPLTEHPSWTLDFRDHVIAASLKPN